MKKSELRQIIKEEIQKLEEEEIISVPIKYLSKILKDLESTKYKEPIDWFSYGDTIRIASKEMINDKKIKLIFAKYK